jgi:hypothetical protein
LFGHVIDGRTIPSAAGGPMPVIDPAWGADRHGGSRVGGRRRRGRALRASRAVPYGSFKISGPGKMLGAAFVEEMTQVKSVWMKVGA